MFLHRWLSHSCQRCLIIELWAYILNIILELFSGPFELVIIVTKLPAAFPVEQRVELGIWRWNKNELGSQKFKHVFVQLLQVFLFNVLDDLNQSDQIKFELFEFRILLQCAAPVQFNVLIVVPLKLEVELPVFRFDVLQLVRHLLRWLFGVSPRQCQVR